ncbi:MAG: hypothetical protein DSY50_03010 [Desulfobulbus sp.]|nr:MAG: hypothetical protein DSY50_03010 [Desulfobulbus sp.]
MYNDQPVKIFFGCPITTLGHDGMSNRAIQEEQHRGVALTPSFPQYFERGSSVPRLIRKLIYPAASLIETA